MSLPPLRARGHLHALNLRLELLDSAVSRFEVLVETIALGNEVLLPLTEAAFLELDLVRKLAAERLFFLLEAWVFKPLDAWLAVLARLHLCLAVVFVVEVLGVGNQVEHVRSDQEGAQLFKVAVVLVFDLGHTPKIFTATDDASIVRAHVLGAADNAERHGRHERPRMLGTCLVDGVDGWRKHRDAMRADHVADALLKDGQVAPRECVGFGDHRDQIDTLRKALHHLDIERLERMARWRNKVQACMHTGVDEVAAVGLLLLTQVRLVLVVNKVDERDPAVAVIHIVAKAGRVDNREVHTELLFLQLGTDHIDLDSLVELRHMALRIVRSGRKLSAKECVDDCV